MSTVRTYLKAIFYISEKVDNLVCSTGFAVLTPNESIEPEIINLTVQSNYFIDQVVSNSVGVAYPAISESKIGLLNLVLPMQIEEQKKYYN